MEISAPEPEHRKLPTVPPVTTPFWWPVRSSAEACRTRNPIQGQTPGGREQGPGAGAQCGPGRRRVTPHKGDSREAAAGADLRSPATRSCGFRPAAPLPSSPLPTQARPPPAFLSPLSLRTGRRESISGLRVFGIDQGQGRGSRWLRRGSWAASLVRGPASLSLCRQRSPPVSLLPGRALRAGLDAASGAAPARGAARAAGGGEAGGQGQPGPRPDMAEVSIDQSKLPGVKEGRGRGVKRAGPLPAPSAGSLRAGASSCGPRGPRRRPPDAGPPGRAGPERRLRRGARAGHLGSEPQYFPV